MKSGGTKTAPGDKRSAHCRHGRAHSKSPRFVRGSADDRAFSLPSDNYWFAAQVRVVPLLDRSVEGIHVDMEDFAHNDLATILIPARQLRPLHPRGSCSLWYISARWHDSIFHAHKILQGTWQARGQFLPGQYLASSAKSGGSYAAHNQEPVLKQVRFGEHRATSRNRDRAHEPRGRCESAGMRCISS